MTITIKQWGLGIAVLVSLAVSTTSQAGVGYWQTKLDFEWVDAGAVPSNAWVVSKDAQGNLIGTRNANNWHGSYPIIQLEDGGTLTLYTDSAMHSNQSVVTYHVHAAEMPPTPTPTATITGHYIEACWAPAICGTTATIGLHS